jgi:hypothetical protein
LILNSDKNVEKVKVEEVSEKNEIVLKTELKIPSDIKFIIEQLVSDGYINKPLEKKFEMLEAMLEKKQSA